MEASNIVPELMTEEEVIAFLRLDARGGNVRERLRNLTRRAGLPYIDYGGAKIFRRESIQAWLDARERGRRPVSQRGRASQ